MDKNGISLPDEMVYSTHPEFEHEYAGIVENDTLPAIKQKLCISLERRKYDGAIITKISGFIGKRINLISIENELEVVCRTSGVTTMNDIILFRDVRKRAFIYLRNQGYGVRFADS